VVNTTAKNETLVVDHHQHQHPLPPHAEGAALIPSSRTLLHPVVVSFEALVWEGADVPPLPLRVFIDNEAARGIPPITSFDCINARYSIAWYYPSSSTNVHASAKPTHEAVISEIHIKKGTRITVKDQHENEWATGVVEEIDEEERAKDETSMNTIIHHHHDEPSMDIRIILWNALDRTPSLPSPPPHPRRQTRHRVGQLLLRRIVDSSAATVDQSRGRNTRLAPDSTDIRYYPRFTRACLERDIFLNRTLENRMPGEATVARAPRDRTSRTATLTIHIVSLQDVHGVTWDHLGRMKNKDERSQFQIQLGHPCLPHILRTSCVVVCRSSRICLDRCLSIYIYIYIYI
jgi:hypothetical protein